MTWQFKLNLDFDKKCGHSSDVMHWYRIVDESEGRKGESLMGLG